MTVRIFGLMGLGGLALAACGQASDTLAQPAAPADAPEGAGLDMSRLDVAAVATPILAGALAYTGRD